MLPFVSIFSSWYIFSRDLSLRKDIRIHRKALKVRTTSYDRTHRLNAISLSSFHTIRAPETQFLATNERVIAVPSWETTHFGRCLRASCISRGLNLGVSGGQCLHCPPTTDATCREIWESFLCCLKRICRVPVAMLWTRRIGSRKCLRKDGNNYVHGLAYLRIALRL